MRLSLILESPQQQAEQLAQRLGLSAEEVVLQCNQISKKYWKWVLQQWYGNKISLPDDSAQIQNVLQQFAALSRRLLPSQKDINQYQSLAEIQLVVDDLEGVPASSKTHDLSKYIGLDGVNVINKRGPYVTLQVSNVEALKELGEGTRWCTRGSHPECKAKYYINAVRKGGRKGILMVFQNGRPILQYTPDYLEIKDYNNINVIDKRLLSLIPAPDFSDVKACFDYARNIIKGRWIDAEPYIMKVPKYAKMYAEYIIVGRWPEAEIYILEDPELAAAYIVNNIRRRYKSFEIKIVRNPMYAFLYTYWVINYTNKGYANTGRSMIRWPEAEPYIMKSPECAYLYAMLILNSRWPEAEPYIIKSSYAIPYARDVIQGDWPEAGITL